MDKTDEEIVIDVQNGNVEPFGILVERYEAKISRYARKFLSNRDDITDLVQDVFMKAYINIQGFDASRKFSSWLYRIAHNEFINAMKKKKSIPFSFFDTDVLIPLMVSTETTNFESEQKEITAALNDVLDMLDPKYKEPIILYYFEELTYQQIAEVLHVPISTVGVRIQRGKGYLKKYYQQKYESK